MKLQKKLIIAVIIILIACLLPVKEGSAQAGSKISINNKQATIWVKNYVNLKIKGTKEKVSWKSNDVSIAKVSSNGKVTGVIAGKATITATVGKSNYSCSVTVKKEKNTDCLTDFLEQIREKDFVDEANNLIDNYSFIQGYQWIDINQDDLNELCIYEEFGTDNESKIIILAAKNGKVVKAGEAWGSLYVLNKKYKILSTLYKNQYTKDEIEHTEHIYHSYYMNNGKLYENTTYYFKVDNHDYYSNNKKTSKDEFFRDYEKYYSLDDMTVIDFDDPAYMNQDTVTLSIGATAQLDVIGSKQEIWVSMDETVATVNDKGEVTAVGPGSVIIFAQTKNGLYYSIINVFSDKGLNAPFDAKEIKLKNLRFILPSSWMTDISDDKTTHSIYAIPDSEMEKSPFSYLFINVYDCSETPLDFDGLKKQVALLYPESTVEQLAGMRTKMIEVTDKAEQEFNTNNHTYYQLTYYFNYENNDGTKMTGSLDVYAALYDNNYVIITKFDFGYGFDWSNMIDYLLNSIQYYN